MALLAGLCLGLGLLLGLVSLHYYQNYCQCALYRPDSRAGAGEQAEYGPVLAMAWQYTVLYWNNTGGRAQTERPSRPVHHHLQQPLRNRVHRVRIIEPADQLVGTLLG